MDEYYFELNIIKKQDFLYSNEWKRRVSITNQSMWQKDVLYCDSWKKESPSRSQQNRKKELFFLARNEIWAMSL